MRGGRAEECRGKGHGHRRPTSSSRSSRDLGTVPAQAGSSRQPLTVPQARIQSAGQGWAESSQVPRSCSRAGGAGPSSRLTAQEGPRPPSLKSVSSTRDTRGPSSLPGLLPAWGEAAGGQPARARMCQAEPGFSEPPALSLQVSTWPLKIPSQILCPHPRMHCMLEPSRDWPVGQCPAHQGEAVCEPTEGSPSSLAQDHSVASGAHQCAGVGDGPR